jgi:hypothetical protein
VGRQFHDAGGGQRHAVLVLLDLFGDADSHARSFAWW